MSSTDITCNIPLSCYAPARQCPVLTYSGARTLLVPAELFRLFDLDKSGTLDAREFTHLVTDLKVRLDRTASEAFVILDRAKSGHIAPADFARWWRSVLPSAWGVGEGCGPSEREATHGSSANSHVSSAKGHADAGTSHMGAAEERGSSAKQYRWGAKEREGGWNLDYEFSLAESRVFPRKLQVCTPSGLKRMPFVAAMLAGAVPVE